jgi:hypothetical protein
MSLAQGGLQHNYVLQELGTLRFSCRTARIEYYLDCNWGGRRALQEEDEKPIPLGLWAHSILAKINRLPLRQTSTGMRYILAGRRESALFSMLRGGPAFRWNDQNDDPTSNLVGGASRNVPSIQRIQCIFFRNVTVIVCIQLAFAVHWKASDPSELQCRHR